ncbi:MAG TPA: polyphosphate kinase 1 [Candidatus Rikenella faecigallinarum]|uniref:Polyphosphate kinase n=1 Tax=Candidatus Rikenella faecigallinarum TaxID=2838745 RepID=A0A9D1QEN5_9BACT|nr:polyphosphate kinase 1 [Candidatus Rikenella faecigallinarum]
MLYNRELSWISFNERVMQEAQDKSVPLLQRLRFLGIYSNNMDEFFKVRVANLERMMLLRGAHTKEMQGGDTLEVLLGKIYDRLNGLQQTFEQTYNEILSEMESHGIYIVDETRLTEAQAAFCRDYFADKISPLLVPLLVRKSTKLPFLRDGHIYHAVRMSGPEPKSSPRYAVVEIPSTATLPRFIVLPPSAEGRTEIIFVDDIIRLCLDDVFFMFDFERIEAYAFKFMRDAEMSLDDDVNKSIIEKMEQGINKRKHGRPVRMVYDKAMPADLLETITTKLGLRAGDNVSPGGRYHLMRDLMKFPKVAPELEYHNPAPLRHPAIQPFSSIIDVIRRQDILLNYPYHTFNHFIDFLREAAMDPKTVSISMTLYRTADHSKIIRTLINAAKNGKKVLVFMELLARFDEERNMENAETLRQAGIKVLYGIEGLKVHSKLVLVERREGAKIKGYTHIGTGNFNENTAGIYSDFSLFTANQQIADDARAVFEFLQTSYKHMDTRQLLVSPFNMRKSFEELIDAEIDNARKKKKAYIYAKCNSLTDEKIIQRLYKASAAGVKVRLIVRGACCLMPGQEEISEHIRAISIVDKYLEHARLFIFCNGGKERVYIGSADWMTRNLNRRVEVITPILDKRIQAELRQFFSIQWHDTVKARDLDNPLWNRYRGDEEDTPLDQRIRSQVALYDYYASLEK